MNSCNSLNINTNYTPFGSIAYAVGNGGVILQRNSGGAWNIVPPTMVMTENLNSIHVIPSPAPGLGVVVGDGGKIHRVDGSGSTCVTNVTTPVMNASQMVTNLIGYAVGEDGVILKTTDAGVSWNVLVSPPGLIGISLNAVYFTSSDVGYIVGNGGKVYYTTNGGTTWTVPTFTPSAPTDNLNDIYFTDANHGVIVGDAGIVYYINTTISPNWNLANVNSVFFSPITGFNLFAVYFTNNVGFIVGSASTIFKSIDFGATWEEQARLIPLSTTYETWTGFIFPTNVPSIINLNDVYFVDQYHGWALGDDGKIIKTKDGGVLWEAAQDLGSPSNDLTAFSFNADGEAIIVGDATGGGTAAIYQFTDQSDRFSSQFWYDKLGRLIISQNTKQNVTNINQLVPKYSYTLYDALGRIKEVGEKDENTTLAFRTIFGADMGGHYNTNVIDDTKFLAWINDDGQRKQITNTYYDLPLAGLSIPGFTQNNLRTRVAFTTFKSTYDAAPSVYDNATHYSYDIHGNVDVLIQDNTALTDMDQRYKRMDYTYDLISGNVNEVAYQKGELDQFYHKYEYDADNRITNVYTSRDGVIWDQDAKYQYYLHGPLARTEIGDLKVQGLDYAYTIQGWLKGVNSNTLNKTRDIGNDGVTTNINQNVAQDEFGFTLGYFNGDYSAINSPASTNFEANTAGSNLLASSAPMYNGNITHMVTAVRAFMQGGASPNATAYKYDQLNRLKEARTHNDAAVVASNQWNSATTSTDNYGVKLTYDDNGNILTLKRNSYINTTPNLDGMDDMTYEYEEIGPRKTNRLKTVNEQATSTGGTHIQPGILSFEYDEIGNLIQDGREEIKNIEWSTYGKILKIERTATSSFSDLEFVYDASGNRITKIVKPRTLGEIDPETEWTYTYYVRDASGNVMAVYENKITNLNTAGQYKATFKQKEVNLYGSSRIGMQATDKILAEREFNGTVDDVTGKIINPSEIGLTTFSGNSNIFSRYIGNKQYELKDHLNNVRIIISDEKLLVNGTNVGNDLTSIDAGDYFMPSVQSFADFFPFGSPMRKYNFTDMNVGFNGKRMDNDFGNAAGAVYDYGFRIYDSRIAKFLSVDPLFKSYPFYTPYQFAANTPVWAIDLDGLEAVIKNGYIIITTPSMNTNDFINNRAVHLHGATDRPKFGINQNDFGAIVRVEWWYDENTWAAGNKGVWRWREVEYMGRVKPREIADLGLVDSKPTLAKMDIKGIPPMDIPHKDIEFDDTESGHDDDVKIDEPKTQELNLNIPFKPYKFGFEGDPTKALTPIVDALLKDSRNQVTLSPNTLEKEGAEFNLAVRILSNADASNSKDLVKGRAVTIYQYLLDKGVSKEQIHIDFTDVYEKGINVTGTLIKY
jgi:RHS repeat-associated protein